MDREASS